MRPLLTLSARSCGISVAATLFMGAAAGAIRLLPWLVSPDVPFRLAAPFARALVLGAAEIAMLVGLPLGAAVAAAVFVERGEARALFALGATPARVVRSLVVPGLAVVLAYVVLAAATGTETPGSLAQHLLSEGRQSCTEASGARRVDVPLVSLAWLCFPAKPRLAGRVPGVGRDTWFTAAGVDLDADLRALRADELELATRLGDRPVYVHVGKATVAGLRGWGRPKALAGALRAAFIGGISLAVAVAAAFGICRLGSAGPVSAGVISGLAATGMAAALSALDARSLPAASYLSVPLLGMALLAACFGLVLPALGRFVAGRNLQ
jgi:hypothetical protein